MIDNMAVFAGIFDRIGGHPVRQGAGLVGGAMHRGGHVEMECHAEK
jgi:hypothetical protein